MKQNKKILITGSTGLLGVSLIKARPSSCKIYAGYYNFPKERLPYTGECEYVEFDIRNKKEALDIFNDISPDIVVHAASLGNVDYCEKNKEEARQTNVEGSANIISACKSGGAALIFTSSNAVFDGEKPPYAENAKPNPIDYYGKTKLETELDLAESGIKYAIARLMTMYGWNNPLERPNPLTWVLEKLAKKEKINVVDDVYNNHLFSDNAAEAIWAIALGNKQGIYHIAGSEIISRYELALSVADIFGLDKSLINPVDSSFFSQIAPRPKNTSYKIDKMERDLSVRGIGIREGLNIMKDNPPAEWKYDWR